MVDNEHLKWLFRGTIMREVFVVDQDSANVTGIADGL